MSGGQVAGSVEESVNRRAGLIFYVLMYSVQCVSLILCLYQYYCLFSRPCGGCPPRENAGLGRLYGKPGAAFFSFLR